MVQVPKFTRPDVGRAGLPGGKVQGVASGSVDRVMQGLMRLDDIAGQMLNDRAIQKGTLEGFEIGSEAERLKLRRDGTLRSQAFNRSALTAFSVRQETLLRQEHARIARENAGDLEAITRGFEAVRKAVIGNSPPEARVALEAISDRLTLVYTERELNRIEIIARSEAQAELENNFKQRELDIRQTLLNIEDPDIRHALMVQEINEITQALVVHGPKQAFTFRGQKFKADPSRTGYVTPDGMERTIAAFESLMKQETVMGIFGRLETTEEKQEFLNTFVADFNKAIEGGEDLADQMTPSEFENVKSRMNSQINNDNHVTQRDKFRFENEMLERINSGEFATIDELDVALDKAVGVNLVTNKEAQQFRTFYQSRQAAAEEFQTVEEALDKGMGEFVRSRLDMSATVFNNHVDAYIEKNVAERIARDGITDPLRQAEILAEEAIDMAKRNGAVYSVFKDAMAGASPGDGANFVQVARGIYLPLANEGLDVMARYIPDAKNRVPFKAFIKCTERAGGGDEGDAMCLAKMVEGKVVEPINTNNQFLQDAGSTIFQDENKVGPGLTDPEPESFFDFGVADLGDPADFVNTQQIYQEVADLAELFMSTGVSTFEEAIVEAWIDVKGTWIKHGDRLVPNIAVKDENGEPLILSAEQVRGNLDLYREGQLAEDLAAAIPNPNARPGAEQVVLIPDHLTSQDGSLVMYDRVNREILTFPDNDGNRRSIRVSMEELNRARTEKLEEQQQNDEIAEKVAKAAGEGGGGGFGGGKPVSEETQKAISEEQAENQERLMVARAKKFPLRKDLVEHPEAGVFDLNRLRRAVDNEDGAKSAEVKITVEVDGEIWVIPSLFDGEIKSPSEALRLARKRREIIQTFDTEAEAAAFIRNRDRFMDNFPNVEALIEFLKGRRDFVAGSTPTDPRVQQLGESILFDG